MYTEYKRTILPSNVYSLSQNYLLKVFFSVVVPWGPTAAAETLFTLLYTWCKHLSIFHMVIKTKHRFYNTQKIIH